MDNNDTFITGERLDHIIVQSSSNSVVMEKALKMACETVASEGECPFIYIEDFSLPECIQCVAGTEDSPDQADCWFKYYIQQAYINEYLKEA